MVTAGMTPRDAVRQLEARLTAAGCPDADYDAAELFRLVTGRDVRLADAPLTEAQAARLEALCLRREAREPLQYLCGRWSFLDFELIVGPGVLCPFSHLATICCVTPRCPASSRWVRPFALRRLRRISENIPLSPFSMDAVRRRQTNRTGFFPRVLRALPRARGSGLLQRPRVRLPLRQPRDRFFLFIVQLCVVVVKVFGCVFHKKVVFQLLTTTYWSIIMML